MILADPILFDITASNKFERHIYSHLFYTDEVVGVGWDCKKISSHEFFLCVTRLSVAMKPKATVSLSRIISDCLRAIANNLKTNGMVIVSVEKKSVSYICYFELFAYFSATYLIYSYSSSAILLCSQSVHKMYQNGRDESSYNRKHIRKHSDR